ncbi:hypothetical protein [Enterobacter sp. Bisph1]|uniref:hypothetical protein n=1 Tax=Enterobacter sp. Bisph1 TaxID=1274399 RepID=UPI00057BD4FC|nr:hypothetical protein [Enterobacter sp. Bisph1]
MLNLSESHLNALYKKAEGEAWNGLLSYFMKGAEHIPLQVGSTRILLELVIPAHIMDPQSEPKYYIVDKDELFLLRRDHRELRVYKVNDFGVLEMMHGDDELLTDAALGPAFRSVLRKALCDYVAKNPVTSQFVIEAKENFAQFIFTTLINDEFLNALGFTARKIEEFSEKYFAFELFPSYLPVNTY